MKLARFDLVEGIFASHIKKTLHENAGPETCFFLVGNKTIFCKKLRCVFCVGCGTATPILQKDQPKKRYQKRGSSERPKTQPSN